jgi:hypothetical protein
MRMEYLFARLTAQINNALGGKVRVRDVVRYYDEEATPAAPNLEQMAKMFNIVKMEPRNGKP